jgi:hypothetical protein
VAVSFIGGGVGENAMPRTFKLLTEKDIKFS